MTDIRWVVQDNLGRIYADEIEKACNELDYEIIRVQAIPFSDEVPDIDNEKRTIFYGATRWISNIYAANKWIPGTFFNPDSIYQTWSAKYGTHTLNHGAHITTIAKLKDEISQAKYGWDDLLFIRPTSDLKEFAGEVIAAKSIYEWSGRVQNDIPDFGLTEVLVSEPVGISNEWRLFIVDGKVSTGSQYRTYHRLNKSPDIPENVIEFAETRALEYSPSSVFVMDIGLSGGELYVIEIGCFNSAGFYDADYKKLIKDISEYVCRSL